MFKKSGQQGFTLIESLVYIVLFVFVSTGSFIALINFQTLFQQYQVRQALFSTGTTVLERVLLEVREARDIDLNGSVWNSDEGLLSLHDGQDDIAIAYADGEIEVRGATSTTSLTDQSVTIDAFRLFPYESDGVVMVRVQLQATSQIGEHQESWQLNSAAVARNLFSE